MRGEEIEVPRNFPPRSVTLDEIDERITEHLYLLWRASDVPQSRIGQAIGLTARQVSLRLGGHSRLSPGQLLKALETVAVDPCDFFSGICGEFHPRLYLARVRLRDHRQVKNTKSDRLRKAASKLYTAKELEQLADGLEELRFIDEHAAKAQAVDILRAHAQTPVEPKILFEARLSLAAFDRTRGNHSAAAYSLLEALSLTETHDSRRGRVLQAVMSLAADLGDFEEACTAISQARAEFRYLKDLQGEGRTWISEGLLRGQMGDLEKATAAYRASLPLVADARWVDRYAALHGLSLCLVSRNSLDEALSVVAELSDLTDSISVPLVKRANALWLRGELRLRLGDSAGGVADMRKVFKSLLAKQANALDLSLVALRLSSLLVDLGEFEDLEKIGKVLTRSLARLPRDSKFRQRLSFGRIALASRDGLSKAAFMHTYREVLKAAQRAPSAAYLAMTD